MAVKITTGEYTQVVVANYKGWAEIKTATEFKADATAKTEEVRAFNDLGEPLVISTDMGTTTGSTSIIRSSTVPFECLAMGLSITHTAASGTVNSLNPLFTQELPATFLKFTLKDAITHPLFLGANFKDKITGNIYGSQWIVNAFLNSDGTNEAVSGTLANTYSYTATMKYSFPYSICLGTYAAYNGDTYKAEWDVVNHYIALPAGVDANGDAINFSWAAGVHNPTLSACDLIAWTTALGSEAHPIT